MKKLWLFMLMLLLTACGSGGGDGESASVQDNGAGTGVLRVDFRHPAAKIAAAVLPEPQAVRIVVWKPSNATPAYKEIKDVVLGNTPADFLLPVGVGYVIEAVSYASDGTVHRLIEYADDDNHGSGYAISIGSSFDATLTLGSIGGPTLATTVNSPQPGQTLDVTATVPLLPSQILQKDASLLQGAWSLATSTTPFVAQPHLVGLVNVAHTGIITPNSPQLYLNGEFYLDPRFTDSAADAKNWTYNVDAPVVAVIGSTIGNLANIAADNYPPHVTSFSASSVQTATPFSVSVSAKDNVAVAGYYLAQTDTTVTTRPAIPGNATWSALSPTAFTPVPAPVNNQIVRIWAFAKDPSGNVSPEAPFTDITYSVTPQITAVSTSTSGVQLSSTVSISITATDFAPVVKPTHYFIATDTATIPSGSNPGVNDAGWRVWDSANATLSYSYTNPDPVDASTTVKSLRIWIKDANGVSRSWGLSLFFCNLPQISGADLVSVESLVPGSKILANESPTGRFNLSPFTLKAFTGNKITGYLLRDGSAQPSLTDPSWTNLPTPANAYTLPAGFTYTYQGYAALPAGKTSGVTITLWAKDSAGSLVTKKYFLRITKPQA